MSARSQARDAAQPWPIALRDAAFVAGGCALVAILVNAWRDAGIPLLARAPHQILVPCPETLGQAAALDPAATALRDPRALVVDARPAADFAHWHAAAAISAPYDYLAPTPAATIQRIAASGAAQVIVYGDGGDPDSGEQLARELAGKGIRNVSFVVGGAPALERRAAGSAPEAAGGARP